ncbi:MAG: RNA polymerase sigma factor [Polyangiales bacterium]
MPLEALRRVSVVEVPGEAVEPVTFTAQPPPVPPEALRRPRRRAVPPPVPEAARAVPDAPDALVLAARRGDPRAFGELVRRYRPRLLALALHLTGSAQDADDIAQDSFLRAFQRIQEFEGRSAFFTWLYRIALNRSLQVIQQRRRRAGVDLDDPRVALAVAVDAHDAPQRALELRETYAHLVYAFDRLSPLLRTTVVLTTLQGLSHPEAAAVLSTTEGTIAWRMHEARNQLRRALDAAAAGQTREEPAEAPRRARRARADDPDAASCALALALASVVSV